MKTKDKDNNRFSEPMRIVAIILVICMIIFTIFIL